MAKDAPICESCEVCLTIKHILSKYQLNIGYNLNISLGPSPEENKNMLPFPMESNFILFYLFNYGISPKEQEIKNYKFIQKLK